MKKTALIVGTALAIVAFCLAVTFGNGLADRSAMRDQQGRSPHGTELAASASESHGLSKRLSNGNERYVTIEVEKVPAVDPVSDDFYEP